MQKEKDSELGEEAKHKAQHANHEAHTHVEVIETGDVEDVEVQVKKVGNTKLAIILAVVVILGALAYSSRGIFVAATVDGSPVSRVAVVSALEKSAGKKALDAIITKKLITEAVRKSGVVIPITEVDSEVKTIEEQIAKSGAGTLPQLLAQQSMTMNDLREQIMLQKQIEKLLGDKVKVTDAEVSEYITKNKLTIPEEQKESANKEIKDQLKQQKMTTEGQKFVSDLRKNAKINYFVSYGADVQTSVTAGGDDVGGGL